MSIFEAVPRMRPLSSLRLWATAPNSASRKRDRPFMSNERLAYLLRNHILCQVKKIFFD
ncbi:MAG: hypothetical protein JGK24_27060 [Microcoleus sp. PH2017_29_MFU_D_A]|uniref:hypothetical protein n=1 Tax=unclassified Microcoleus TaxID=2642155 RepID=UPI001DBFA0B5|nr:MULTISPECIES: hypothetical protein [unclassified Microcoleus]MCC3472239.1 hypothetical protein [Microcoleus sp. PH2017_13_LAR_U_A]MCC3484727.1 hypothetical protein [Microcoleus sp. PH2017_14_LAR_D_A]MCC3494016.1 hypothetical protein [Microcoleus sp. PH2017_16_JOR_D_A]MCC3496178.1 hypothetical protein [Microcoleus sp. PH2017_15_JOR_U_A]MCC3515035.1 hypothetical protein [Microcoleus sp. PH2017_18_LLB_O_A]